MIIHLDGQKMHTRPAAHTYIKEQLSLPDYYGRNLDALYDLLTERGEACTIVLQSFDTLQENLGEYANLLAETLNQAAESNPLLIIEIQ